MMYDMKFTSDLHHLQQDTCGKGQGCCSKARRAQKAVRPACFQHFVDVSCIYRKIEKKAKSDAVTIKRKRMRFEIEAYAHTTINNDSVMTRKLTLTLTGKQIVFSRQ